jgi:hypothetical protein
VNYDTDDSEENNGKQLTCRIKSLTNSFDAPTKDLNEEGLDGEDEEDDEEDDDDEEEDEEDEDEEDNSDGKQTTGQ